MSDSPRLTAAQTEPLGSVSIPGHPSLTILLLQTLVWQQRYRQRHPRSLNDAVNDLPYMYIYTHADQGSETQGCVRCTVIAMDSSPPCFRGYGTRFVLPCVFVPLVLVSLLLLSVDSNGPTPWFSSFSFSLPLHGGGGAHKEKDLESQRGFGAQVSFDRSGHASDVSVPPVAAPSPVQGPVSPLLSSVLAPVSDFTAKKIFNGGHMILIWFRQLIIW